MNTSIPPAGETEIELAVNSEPRCPCNILADCSGSMSGASIAELNAGLQELKAKLVQDPLACLRVELALVSFNSTSRIEVDFTSPDKFNPPTLTTGGGTALGAAVLTGLGMLASRRAAYRSAGTPFYRPWLVLITDAEATDNTVEAARRVKEEESLKRVAFFGIGVRGANMTKLAELSLRPPLHLDGLRFCDLFEWLSVNLSSVAVSRPGEQVPLTPVTWNTV